MTKHLIHHSEQLGLWHSAHSQRNFGECKANDDQMKEIAQQEQATAKMSQNHGALAEQMQETKRGWNEQHE